MSSPSEIARRLTNAIVELKRHQSDIAVEATLEVKAQFDERVFEHGLTTSRRRIGTYSTKPTYVSIAGTRRKYGSQIRSGSLRGRGKNTRGGKFKNGNSRKSMYMKGGYAEFRRTVGRQSSRVDLNLSGNLRKSIDIGTKKSGAVLGFVDPEAARLAETLERKYGTQIFSPSKQENKASEAIIEQGISEIMLKNLIK